MKKKVNPLGIFCAAMAAFCLAGIILGRPQHFFGFLTFSGLAYALLTEKPQEKKTN